MTENVHTWVLSDEQSGRLDHILCQYLPNHSRTQIQSWIKKGFLSINGTMATQPKTAVTSGDRLRLEQPESEAKENWAAQAIDLDILFEDEHLLVINKPAGLIMHPGAGQRDGTLANALAYHHNNASHLPRCGIVHRLDQWTSGLCVVAKTEGCYQALIQSMQTKKIERHYRAWVHGDLSLPNTITTHMGRHPTKRTQQAVVRDGKIAITHYRIERRHGALTELALRLETGRTHQIRVHMHHLKHAIVGDPTYRMQPKRAGFGERDDLYRFIVNFPRQALHAYRLILSHPITNEPCSWTAPLPHDLATLQDKLTVLEAPYDEY